MKIVTAEQMRQIDRECTQRGIPVSTLMENAGRAVAEEVKASIGASVGQNILCLVGGGNNGGDGLVAARCLHDDGIKTSIYLCAKRPPDDENLNLAQERGITCIEAENDKNLKKLDELLANATIVIDALLGTGKMRPLEGVFKQALEKATRARQERGLKIVAIDLPSGMDANTGVIDPACSYADMTVTLGFPKLGLFSFPGAERVGQLEIVDIGIPEELAEAVTTELITDSWAKTVLPERPLNANKGSFGRVLVTAGSINYIGAAYLACVGAQRAGAGLVTLATAASLQPILAAKLTEITYLPLPESQPGFISVEADDIITQQGRQYDVLLMGCGLGQDPSTVEFVSSLILEKELPLPVLDADALNILPKIPEWWQWLTDHRRNTVGPPGHNAAVRRGVAPDHRAEGSLYGHRHHGWSVPGEPLRQSGAGFGGDRRCAGRGHCGAGGAGAEAFRRGVAGCVPARKGRRNGQGKTWRYRHDRLRPAAGVAFNNKTT
jgi:hydroxyethylthiazole kinase-like uncharacterized protein yjeF